MDQILFVKVGDTITMNVTNFCAVFIVVVSCMIKYPGTGCTTDFTQPLLGYSDQQCSCHVGCFNQNNNLKCCEDIGCMRKYVLYITCQTS